MMKQKTNRVTKAVIICLVIAMMTLYLSVAVSAETDTLSNGYSVSAYVTLSGKKATGVGRVTSGGPCSINVTTYPYYKSNGVLYSYYPTVNSDYNTYVEAVATAPINVCGGYCFSTFNSEKTVRGYTGTYFTPY